jgi:aryl-alcohol dehydrogenase-like predicted oxidoreductase
MHQVSLGSTGIETSALCLGCMYFGTRIPEQTSFMLLDQFLDAGGTFLDTSNNYVFWLDDAHGGESETLLGRWMQHRKMRDQVVLATKVGAMPKIPGGGFAQKEGLSADAIIRAVEGSLTRLQTDYIDLYYAHIDDRDTPLDETLEAFDRLVRAGKVRALGCSNMVTWRIEQARSLSRTHHWAVYSCIQQRHSYLRPKIGADFGVQESATEELLDYCRVHDDVRLLAYSPLLGGVYTRRDVPLQAEYAGADTNARMHAVTQVATEVHATPNQVVLAWLMQGTPVVIPLIAASTSEQLQENMASVQVQLSSEHLKLLTCAGA